MIYRNAIGSNGVADSSASSTRLFRFGLFEIDLCSIELRRNGSKIKLQNKSFQLLVLLLERAGNIVPREELRNGLWTSDTFVDFDGNIKTALNRVRQALGDTAENPVFIETIPRVGYRFIAPVTVITSADWDASVSAAVRAPQLNAERYPVALIPKAWNLPAAICGVLIVGIVVTAVYLTQTLRSHEANFSSHAVVLLVRPFENLSGDPSQEFLSDGLTDEMITLLGQRSQEGLSVISWASATHDRDRSKSLTEVVRDFGHADYVLAGSVRRSGTHVAVNAQLFRSRDEAILWAQSYESELADILRVQQDIADRISRSLVLKLIPAHATVPSDPSVHDAYLMGLYEANRRTADGVRSSIEHFHRAIQKDPRYAPAYAGLANSYLAAAGWLMLKPIDAYPGAKAAALKAIELDGDLAEAHAALAESEHVYYWKWAEAEKEFRKAIELNPNSSLAHKSYAEFLMHARRNPEAVVEIERAQDLDPLSLIVRSLTCFVHSHAGENDRAVLECERVIQLDPQFAPGHYFLGTTLMRQSKYEDAIVQLRDAVALSNGSPIMECALGIAYAHAGRVDEARRLLKGLERKTDGTYVSPYGFAQILSVLGEQDHALTALDRAVDEHSYELLFLRVDPSFDTLRGNHRFERIVTKIGFPS